MGNQEISRRERKKDETRQRIVEQAMTLFTDRGYDSVTMEQIAEAADVAKGTLYNYFPVKEAIVSAYMRNSAREKGSDVAKLLDKGGNTRERLAMLFVGVARWQSAQRDLHRHYLKYRMTQLMESLHNPELRSGFEQNLQMILRRGMDDGELRSDLPVADLSGHLESAYLMVMMNWLTLDEYDYETGLLQMIDLFISGAQRQSGKGTT